MPETDHLQQTHIPDKSSGSSVYSVSRLNREIRFLLESEYRELWLEGEISNFKHHTSGHMYLSLKDAQSQISAVFFSRQNSKLKFKLKDGMKVLVFGKISLYEPRGQYQFYIERVEPKGIGALQLAFQQLKEKLQKEGLFAPEAKKEIPKFPGRVGVITSPTGAAIRDILNVIERRFCGTHVLLYPVRVQGEGSAEEIAEAIRVMNQSVKADVLIVGRGGGSLEDLWAFNEECVARAIYVSRIPVISAVGHEIDWTIADLVADYRAPTPSAAAEIVVQSREELEIRLRDFQQRMRSTLQNSLSGWKETLTALQESYAFKQPLSLIRNYEQRLDEMMRQVQNYMKALVSGKAHAFENIANQLHSLSPLGVLQRGYSLTFKEGRLLRDIRQVKSGDMIETRLADGILKSKVTGTEKANSTG